MTRARAALLGAALSLASGCSTSSVGALPTSTKTDPGSFKLQFAVGTATLAGYSSGTVYGLNVVETFRNAQGASATTTNTPTLQGPPNAFQTGAHPISTLAGITPTQARGLLGQIQANGVLASPVAPPVSAAFGLTIGAFGYGLSGDNLVDPATLPLAQLGNATRCPEVGAESLNVSGSLIPDNSLHFGFLWSPIADAIINNNQLCNNLGSYSISPQAYPFAGGPPIWPSPGGYGQPIGFPGWSSGFTTIVPCASPFSGMPSNSGLFVPQPGGPFGGTTCASAAPVVAGTYSLDVAVSQGGAQSDSYTHFDASAALPAAVVNGALPTIPTPVVHIAADGTALVDVNPPADPRIAETIVYLVVPDCGNGSLAPAGNEVDHYYSLITKQTGPQTLFISNLGPPDATGAPTHTFCNSADLARLGAFPQAAKTFRYEAVAVGFDYPAFEASYPANREQQPTISNASTKTADLTISPLDVCPLYVPPLPGTTISCGTQSQ